MSEKNEVFLFNKCYRFGFYQIQFFIIESSFGKEIEFRGFFYRLEFLI